MKKREKKYYFFRSYLDEGEKILEVIHRHILVLKLSLAKPNFFGIWIPLILFFMFPKLWPVFLLWGFLGLIWVLYHVLNWYFDVWLLTNMGVIDIERNGFFDVSTTRVEYHMMEGIAYSIKGVLPTIFNYGDITIDKIGAKTSVVLKDATNPKKVERKVLEYQQKYVTDKSMTDHQALKDMLAGMIAYHIQNNKIAK